MTVIGRLAWADEKGSAIIIFFLLYIMSNGAQANLETEETIMLGKAKTVVTEEMDEMTAVEVENLEQEGAPKKPSLIKRIGAKIPAPIKKGAKIVAGAAAAGAAIYASFKIGEGIGELNARREDDNDGDQLLLEDSNQQFDLDEFTEELAADPNMNATEF